MLGQSVTELVSLPGRIEDEVTYIRVGRDGRPRVGLGLGSGRSGVDLGAFSCEFRGGASSLRIRFEADPSSF